MKKMTSNNKFFHLEWDTDFFGVKSAKVQLNESIIEKEKQEILNFTEKYEFITILNMNNDKKNNKWIGTNTSAFLVDINIQLIKNVTFNKFDDENTSIIKDYKGSPQIFSITKGAFKTTRFFKDDNISNELSEKMYENWLENSFEQKDKYFVLYTKDNFVHGYILFNLSNKEATIELIAVNENSRKRNIGKAMICKLEKFLSENKISRLNVGTQVDNISALKFYIKNGFSIHSSNSIYHLWNKESM